MLQWLCKIVLRLTEYSGWIELSEFVLNSVIQEHVKDIRMV
jgi:hypothetical protein